MRSMRCCLNPKVIGGLALVAVGVLVLAPHAFGAALSVLIVLICPLSMIAMAIAMARRGNSGSTSCGTGSHVEDRRAELAELRQEVQRLRQRRGKAASPLGESSAPTLS